MDKLDEYIEHYEMLSTEYERSPSLTEQFTQLAEWLKELRDYRLGMTTCAFCKYKDVGLTEQPCLRCEQAYANMFEREDMPNE